MPRSAPSWTRPKPAWMTGIESERRREPADSQDSRHKVRAVPISPARDSRFSAASISAGEVEVRDQSNHTLISRSPRSAFGPDTEVRRYVTGDLGVRFYADAPLANRLLTLRRPWGPA